MSKSFKLFLSVIAFVLFGILFAYYYLGYFLLDETSCMPATKCMPANACFCECKKEGFIKYHSCIKNNNCEELSHIIN